MAKLLQKSFQLLQKILENWSFNHSQSLTSGFELCMPDGVFIS